MPKCRSMAIQASTGKRVSPTLSISGRVIPPAEDGAFKFLGMLVRVHSSNDDARSALRGSLLQMLTAIDKTPLTHQQKLRLFKQGDCPRLSWPLLVVPSHGWSVSCSLWQPRPSRSGRVLLVTPILPSSFSLPRGVVWLCHLWLDNTRSCRHPRWFS